MERYKHLNVWLKEKFGERVLKICIDGGFSCPNRDGTKGVGGCIFCSECGSGEHIKEKQIENQIMKHLESYRGGRANKFVAYFQNFSNTYDKPENLKRKYDAALKFDKIVALAVATRPDCISEEVAELLESYAKSHYVWVELGLQTANDKTFLNKCYTSEDFVEAVKILNNHNIDVVAHIMIGLPGETKEDLRKTIEFLNRQNIQGIKIHSTYVVKNTKLEEMFLAEEYKPIEFEEYIESVIFVLENINPKIVVHRISGDAPKNLLVAPEWNLHKKWILNGVDKKMKELNSFQGKHFKK